MPKKVYDTFRIFNVYSAGILRCENGNGLRKLLLLMMVELQMDGERTQRIMHINAESIGCMRRE